MQNDNADSAPKRLNVGCGRDILPGWVNLDGQAGPGVDVVGDLEACGSMNAADRLPFENETFDEILISHVLEHVRNVYPLISELWRVAKPNAIMTCRVPYGSSDDAWEDQTHVRAYFLQSWGYFGQPYHWRVPEGAYGYKVDWKAEAITLKIKKSILDAVNATDDPTKTLNKWVRHERNIVQEMSCTLRKVDPPRPADRSLVAVPPISIEAVND